MAAAGSEYRCCEDGTWMKAVTAVPVGGSGSSTVWARTKVTRFAEPLSGATARTRARRSRAPALTRSS